MGCLYSKWLIIKFKKCGLHTLAQLVYTIVEVVYVLYVCVIDEIMNNVYQKAIKLKTDKIKKTTKFRCNRLNIKDTFFSCELQYLLL